MQIRHISFAILWCVLSSGGARALEFSTPLPKSIAPERASFTLTTRAQEFVFFESSPASSRELRFSRLESSTGALLDQPLLVLPELVPDLFVPTYTTAQSTALSDGGFVLALSFQNMFTGPNYTRFYRFNAAGQFVTHRDFTFPLVYDFFQSGADEITVFPGQSQSRLALRVGLAPQLPSSEDVSAANICPSHLVSCTWRPTRRSRARPVDAAAQTQIVRTHLSPSNVLQVDLLRVDANGRVLGVYSLPEQAADTSASLSQFERGALLGLHRNRQSSFSFFNENNELLWNFPLPTYVRWDVMSADAQGLTLRTIDGTAGHLMRFDGSGALLWTAKANTFGAVVFHAGGAVATQLGGGWRWFSPAGELRPLESNLQSVAFSADGGVIATEPALTETTSSRLHRFNADGQPTLAQAILRSDLIPSTIELRPNALGVDFAYRDSGAFQVWRYNSIGFPTSYFQIPGPSEVIFDSADRSFVRGPLGTVRVLGPRGVLQWELGVTASTTRLIVPLYRGIVQIERIGSTNAFVQSINANGLFMDHLTFAAVGVDIRCSRIDPLVSSLAEPLNTTANTGDLATCFYPGAVGEPSNLVVLDQNYRFSPAPTLIHASGALNQFTEDGGVLLTETPAFPANSRHLRFTRSGEQRWEVQTPRNFAVIPTRSGGAWLRDPSNVLPLRHVDASGVVYNSTLQLTGSIATLGDDSVLFAETRKISRVTFNAGQFVLTEYPIDPSRIISGAISVNGMRSAWLERTSNRQEYFLRMRDWSTLAVGR